MDIDLFLWPMLIPMLIPLLYCTIYKRESFAETTAIIVAMIFIVIFYWPMSSLFVTPGNIVAKFFLFVILPILFLIVVIYVKKSFFKQKYPTLRLQSFGIQKKGVKKSLWLCILFLPIMLIVTFIIKYFNGVPLDADFILGTILLIEAFTEEFFFRGILFIYLLDRTDIKIAYITSLASFILMHPQHFTQIFIITTIVQGILTIEIARKSGNITGSWLLHGINRFFITAIIPLLLLG